MEISKTTVCNGVVVEPHSTDAWQSQLGGDYGEAFVSFKGFRDVFGVIHKIHQLIRNSPTGTKFKIVLHTYDS